MGWNINQTVTIERTTCYECGVPIYLESSHMEDLKKSHKTFHCPAGHAQHFIGKTEAEKLREKLEAEKAEKAKIQHALNRERNRANGLAAELAAAEKPDEGDEESSEEPAYKPRFVVSRGRRHLLRERGRENPGGEAEDIAKTAISEFGYDWDDLTDKQIDAVIEYVELGQTEGVSA